MKKLPAFWLWFSPVFTGALFFLIWYGIKMGFGVSDWILPTPWQILQAAWFERGRLLPAAGNTVVGALVGFLAAASLGFVTSLVLASSRTVRAGLYPWLLVLQMTPVIVLTPIIVLWPLAGPGLRGIIVITWLISYFPIVANTTQGLISADLNQVALFRMANATRWQEMFYLRVPAAMPYYLTGLRIAATLAPIGAIFGEFIVGNSSGGSGGLGYLVYSYNSQIKIPALFATALTSCLLGFLFVAAISLLNWAVLHKWHDSFERDDH